MCEGYEFEKEEIPNKKLEKEKRFKEEQPLVTQLLYLYRQVTDSLTNMGNTFFYLLDCFVIITPI